VAQVRKVMVPTM